MTTTSTALETQWETYVFRHANIKAISPVFFSYDPTNDSEFEISSLYHNQKINYWAYQITKTEKWIGTNVLQETFAVVVDYVKEKDTKGATWADVRDGIETLLTQVRTYLGDTWQSTVNYWAPPEEPPVIEETVIQETPAWRGRLVFTAYI